MQKKPIILIFTLVLVVLALIQYRLDVRTAYSRSYEIETQRKERGIRVLASIVNSIFMTGRRDILEGHLMDAVNVGMIDFYLLTYKDEVVAFQSYRPMSDVAYDSIKEPHTPDYFWKFESKYEGEAAVRNPASSKASDVSQIDEFRFFEIDLGDSWRIKLGSNINREAYIAETEEKFHQENRRMLIFGLLVTIGVFFFSARDIMRVAKAMRSKGKRSILGMTALSQEAEILQRGISGFEEAVDRLERERKALGAQVLPSLQSELNSGKRPPYDFTCTMVRTDINNFTKIFHSHPTESFLKTINEFFQGCSHVISRYDGLIHEFVGDEIIFYLKDENHVNSFTAALACVAEINQIAERIHKRTLANDGYDFRVKSSLAHGKIRFGPLLNGFSLAGAPLIETTRILSSVHEKNENTVHFDSNYQSRLNAAVEVVEAFKTNLKGMEGERTVLRYMGHRAFSAVIALDEPNLVFDYRDEGSLVEMLRHMRQVPDSKMAQAMSKLLSGLRVTENFGAFVTMIKGTIVEFRDAKGNEAGERLLASLARSVPRLVTADLMDVELQADVLSLLESPNQRVAANAIEALQDMQAVAKFGQVTIASLLDSKNNRIAANALVYVGSREISKDVLARIQKAVDGKDEAKIASILYAVGEIARHHRLTDPVYYRTQTKFHAFLRTIPSLAKRYPGVEKQAIIALQKAEEGEALQALAS